MPILRYACLATLILICGCVPINGTSRGSNPSEIAHSYYHEGLERGTKNDYAGALSCFQKAIQIKPDYYKAYFLAGLSLFQIGSYAEALNYSRQVLALKPDYLDALALEGECLFMLKKFHECIEVTKNLVKYEPRNGVDTYYSDKLLAYDALALSDAYIGNYTEAIQYLKEVIATKTTNAAAAGVKSGARNLIACIEKEIQQIQQTQKNKHTTANNVDYANSKSSYRKMIVDAVSTQQKSIASKSSVAY